MLLFDFAIGLDALERTLSALRSSPLGASIAIFVPQQTALPPAVASLANACVVDTTSGNLLAAALRDAAWTPWQPDEGQAGATPRDDFFWKAFDALPVPVLVVDAGGTIVHANAACAKLANGAEIENQALSSFFVAEDGPAIAALILRRASPAGTTTRRSSPRRPMARRCRSCCSRCRSCRSSGRPELALRCELRADAAAAAPAEPDLAAPDYASEIAALTASRDELKQSADTARSELTRLRQDIAEARDQVNAARRERDDSAPPAGDRPARFERMRELERAGAARVSSSSASSPTRHDRRPPRRERRASWLRPPRSSRWCATSWTACACAPPARAPTPSAARCATRRSRRRPGRPSRSSRRLAPTPSGSPANATRPWRPSTPSGPGRRRARRRTRRRREEPQIGGDDAAAHSAAKLQRQIDELRAEVKQEQDARRELEELLDQNAENLEQTIEDYEAKLEALGAGAEDKRASKPKNARAERAEPPPRSRPDCQLPTGGGFRVSQLPVTRSCAKSFLTNGSESTSDALTAPP